jgi:hypothetical protein
VNINPDLYHPKLPHWQLSGKNTAVLNGYRNFLPLVPRMDVRLVVLFVISVKNGNQNSIEH